jgi:hypothetical protein
MRAPRVVSAALLLILAALPLRAGEIFVDFYAVAPNTGFFDPTPAAPVGGNPGTTLGEQRRLVFLQAAALWTEVLKPKQDIYVAAQFEPLAAGVLGAAGAQFIWSNFPGAERANTWYFDSLADQHFEGDLSPPTYDVIARFSSNFNFYLGFDNNDGPGQADLLVVVLHEIGHGLNFANAVNETTGAIPVPDGATEPFGDIYSQYTEDVTTSKGWNDMTAAERAASAINVRKVSWTGLHVRQSQHKVLEKGEPAVRVLQPAVLGSLMLGTASFGPPLTAKGLTGDVALAESSSGTDGCTPILNDVAGKIALIDRGTCTFTAKVLAAQNAGAIGVLIADNVLAVPPPGLAGTDPAITIPSGRITLPDGNNLKANLPNGVRVRLMLDKTVVAGTDRLKGQVMLAALNPVVPGSSISHFEAVAFPNQIMEPSINVDLVSSVQPPEDLTTPLLTDLGWFTDRDGVLDGVDVCLGSNISPTVTVGACDSEATNDVLENGCSVSDFVDACAAFRDRSRLLYLACELLTTSALRHGGVITGPEQAAILSCARSY